jgi:LAO/AO transport system kinase
MSKDLLKKMEAGNRLALSRLITRVESRSDDYRSVLKAVYRKTGRAEVVGVTGPPGAGKSTLVDALIGEYRALGKTVAVLAIDPSSPFSGGALLGDRIRMQKHASDQGVFIRSLGTRGRHGGLSHATREVVMLLDGAGFDVILVETAGVGQTELDILTVAQTVVVVLVPESGDSIQMMKAGLLEIADVFVVNKSDRPGADRIVQELTSMVAMAPASSESAWKNPIVQTEAVHGRGISDVVGAVARHQQHLTESGEREKLVSRFLRAEIEEILQADLSARLKSLFKSKQGTRILMDLLKKKTDPYSAAKSINPKKTK